MNPFDLRRWIEAQPAADVPPPNGHAAGRRDAVGGADRPAAGPAGRLRLIERARKCVFGMSDSVAGQDGHSKLYAVARTLVDDFGLTRAEAYPIFADWNAARAKPPEDEKQLNHKLDDVIRNHPNPSGRLRDAPPPNGYVARPRPGDAPPPPPSGPPVDPRELSGRAEAIVVTAKIEELYRARDFLADLARLEAQDKPEAEAIKASLRRIAGFREKAFNAVMVEHRMVLQQAAEAHAAQQAAAGGPTEPEFEFSDMGNGRRLVALHGRRLRHCKAYGDWMIYDGRRWAMDELYAIESMAQEIPGRILAEMPPTRDSEVIDGYHKWFLASQSKDRLAALIQTARSMVAVTPLDLDRDPWLLNVRNGTIDLKSGTFREHRSSDLITKVARVSYDPAATCPAWERFIADIMNEDEELVSYLRRAVGYSITGVIREHVFFFLYGSGRNGKTTFLNALFSILGDYANDIDSDLLISKPNDQHPTGLTELEGRRLVTADETDDGRRLAEGLVKKLTGGGAIKARKMHHDFYTFMPSHHLFFAANYKPEIRGMDNGIWRRVKLIPFEVSFDLAIPGGREPDLELESKLVAESSGILNWMLQGCREWQEDGLNDPEAVRAVVAEYKQEMDTLGWFLGERCVASPSDVKTRTALDTLYLDYTSWCNWSGVMALSKRRFSGQLTDKGHRTKKSNSGVYKLGVRLKTLAERDVEAKDRAKVEGTEDTFEPPSAPVRYDFSNVGPPGSTVQAPKVPNGDRSVLGRKDLE